MTGIDEKSSDFEKIQWAIAELTKIEKCKNEHLCDIKKVVNNGLRSRLAKLIGTKPLLLCFLNGVESQVLWDTGSQVCVVDENWLSLFAPDAIVRPISEFLDDGEKIEFLAANNTEVPMKGAVILDFAMGGEKFQIPFVITTGTLANPIIGFNVVEHLVSSGKPDLVVSTLQKALGNVSIGTINVMVDLINRNFEDDDCVGVLKCVRDVKIPAKGVARIKCRLKGDVKGIDLSFVCSAPTTGDWDEDLEVTQALGEIVRGRTPNVTLEIRNNSSFTKELRSNMVVGEVCSVNAVIPVPVSRIAADLASIQMGEGMESSGKVEGSLAEETPDGEKWQPKANLDHLPVEQREQVERLLWEECDLFAKNDTDIGLIPDLQMEINLVDETPVNEAYRHLPRKLYNDVKTYLNDLIINGWIRESKSDFASPIVCVRKKDGSMRLCVDYRKLNQKTVADRQPIPRVQDLLDGLHGQRYFSTLDMAKAYHQGFIKESCRKYTAFTTPWSIYEWLRIPFGLKGAPAAFQRYIARSLTGLLDRVCLAYLDDILVYGQTFEEHLGNLRSVFRRLRSKGVKLRVDKCFFVMREVRYLGRLVSEKGYRPDPEDTKALEKFREPPKNVGEVRTMMGFLSYYWAHVGIFAKKMKPIYDLIKWKEVDTLNKKTPTKSGYDRRRAIVWSEELQKLVDDVLDTLQSPQVMAYPDFDQPFVLNCDASGYGLGAVLYQRQGEEMRVISYAS